MANNLDDSVRQWLEDLSLAADPPPWRSMVEGRDHVAGDSFIMIGQPDDRAEDLYLSRDSGPAKTTDFDVVAAARTYLPLLVAEVRRLRRTAE